MDPHEHYLRYGRSEGRKPAPESSPARNTAYKAWRVFKREGCHGLWNRAISLKLRITRPEEFLSASSRNDYTEWIRRYNTLTDDKRAELRAVAETLPVKPLISIVMPVYNPKPEWLIGAIESVRGQIYPRWELCVSDDASTDKTIRAILDRYVEEDLRIKVVFREKNGHICAASNSALETAAGEWVALLDHDDLLAEDALLWVADAINRHPETRLLYSDEDKINKSGCRFDPYFKCDWNLDLFYSHNLFSHLGVYQTALLRDAGGFRLGFEGSQDYDLTLRCIEHLKPGQIRHIPRILYHWRAHAKSTALTAKNKPYAYHAGEKALNEHFKRQGVKATIELLDFGMYRIRYALPAVLPLVSLIIPSRNRLRLLQKCIESVLKKTTYPNYEILIIDNGSDELETLRGLEQLRSDQRIRVVCDNRPFNYSSLNNAAVKLARGEVVGLLNNDLEVISPEWLSEMVSHALRPGVGAVGAQLWYPDETLQHAGVTLGFGGVAGHAHRYLPRHKHGYFGRARLTQSFSAVTAACLVIRKSLYEEIGGFNELDLKVAFNDIDLCLRLGEAGYRNIWTPYAELYHHESATRGLEDTPEKQARFSKEVRYMKQRWGNQLLTDPAYSLNLTLDHEDFSLAWPPRTNQPASDTRKPYGGIVNILDAYSTETPSPQNILDIFSGEWSSRLPAGCNLVTSPGHAGLFEDQRIDWAAAMLGGFAGKTCLELGPLEGGHSYMMQKMGAKNIIAIEGNSRAFLKCLCIKEIFGLGKVEFRYGDFRSFFVNNRERYDILVASGVLYHMLDPLRLIRQMSAVSDRLFIWTHYYDADIINSRADLRSKFRTLQDVDRDGARYQCIEQAYDAALNWNGFCGGSAPTSRWLTRGSIINYLKANGYNRLDISFEAKDHPNGPSFAVCAQRE